MFVGITSGATTVWNPLSGTSSSRCSWMSRLLLRWLLLLRLVHEHHRGVHLDAVVRLAGAQRGVHRSCDHDGVNHERHRAHAEHPLAVLLALGLDEIVEHGFSPSSAQSGNPL